jgi:hypothetical protein
MMAINPPIASDNAMTEIDICRIASRSGQVTFRISAMTLRYPAGIACTHATARVTQLPPPGLSPDRATSTAIYFVSLWTMCLSHRGQYFFHSTRSGCVRLFFEVK